MQNLNVTLIQSELIWENPEANLQSFDMLLQQITPGSTDLIVLPEMFTTGFSMNAEVAETHPGLALEWMRETAHTKQAAVTASVLIRENGTLRNRMYFVQPNGQTDYYDKRHLFRMAGEHENISAGEKQVIVEYMGWRIMLQICYDLRFPIWSRNRNNYDLLLYVANWPVPRVSAWSTLLRARAIENYAYTIGVNRVGEDAKGLLYNGQSVVVDFKGETLVECGDGINVATVVLDAVELRTYREKFPVWRDADNFTIG